MWTILNGVLFNTNDVACVECAGIAGKWYVFVRLKNNPNIDIRGSYSTKKEAMETILNFQKEWNDG